jgi:uncharacterized integral membrane protein
MARTKRRNSDSEEDTIRQELGPEVQKTCHTFFNRLCDQLGLQDVSPPKVLFEPNVKTPYGTRETDIPTCHSQGIITITEPNMYSKGAYGEEISHYLRNQLRGSPSRNPNTEEFYGFLGRRLLAPKETHEPPFKSDQEYRQYILKINAMIKSEKDNARIAKLKRRRKDAQDHYEGYNYAAKIDPSKIKNWKDFFSMPEEEVHRRFFREDPDYPEERKEQGELESKLPIILISLSILSILYSVANTELTGLTIAIPTKTNFTAGVILLAFLLLGLIILSHKLIQKITRKTFKYPLCDPQLE